MAHQHITSSYMEHGLCLNWEKPLVFLHVGSDILTAISYYSIPIAMFYFAYRRRDLPFFKIFIMFAVFILSCGTTHLFAAYTIYRPEYWIEGYIKAFTALVSVVTAVIFIPRLPEALAFPSLANSMNEITRLNTELKQKNIELQMANHSIEKLFDPVYWISTGGKILRVNEAVCTSLGYSREEMQKMSVPDFDPHFPADNWPEHWEELKKVGSMRFETQHRCKDGSLQDVEVVANYMSYEGEEFICSIIRNISERKQLELVKERRMLSLTSPLEEIGDVQFTDLFDLEEIQLIQDAFASATGVASIITNTEGMPITKPSNFCDLCMNIIRKTEKGFENCCRSDAMLGKLNPVGPIMQPCMSGGLWDGGTSIKVGNRHIANWLIGQVLDESCDMESMKAYAREIGADEEAYNDALQKVKRMSVEQFKEVCNALFLIAGQLSNMALQNIQQARHITEKQKASQERELLINQLQEKTSELERFIYTVSHDLKSPLITISGFLGFLKEDFKNRDEAEFTSTISRISLASERMKQLLDELLELSRIGRKTNPPEKVNLNALVHEVIDVISGRIQEFAAVVEVDPDLPEVMVDRRRILQVYENLIDNAVKFSSGQATPPHIIVGVRRNEKELLLFVADNGIGIETHYSGKIFELFEKLDPRSSGTGVGLAIVKRVIEVHGGRIWAESEGIGRGTTFCFTLPLVNI